jgi:hypothetical protein
MFVFVAHVFFALHAPVPRVLPAYEIMRRNVRLTRGSTGDAVFGT